MLLETRLSSHAPFEYDRRPDTEIDFLEQELDLDRKLLYPRRALPTDSMVTLEQSSPFQETNLQALAYLDR